MLKSIVNKKHVIIPSSNWIVSLFRFGAEIEAIYMDSDDRVNPPRDNFINCLCGSSSVKMMLGLTLKCKDGESLG